MTMYHSIGIIGRLHSQTVIETVTRIIKFLRPRGHEIVVHHAVANNIDNYQGRTGRRRDIGEQCDLAIVVGGDGSMLAAARVLAIHDVPVIGVNRGKLGFLTDISPEEVEDCLAQVLSGKYEASSRFMLSAKVMRDGQEVARGSGLNDIVLHPGQSARMLTYDLLIDKRPVYADRADGVIIATPTGSTAYALSAGGPIMHPGLDAIALVPMHPHNLSSRPLVVSADAELALHLGQDNQTQPVLSIDGQVHITLEHGDTILVQRHLARLKVLHPIGHHFYERCRSKLGWHAHATTF
ncbi:MAG: NAD(+) kinase [Gammaproteobacteria bacterium]|jgi:NAD+ kinase|nr:NAD(+) kinase [Gammaproteobacteria bacterium]MCP4881893.1 NAD(+) kinase [Gammaproteobacteria bacterium]MDP6165032.1 NAD(+) kinase [Gammaproteobacteria bacterium]